MRLNGNYFGDTIKYAAFKVFSLEKPIEKRDDGYLYSTSTVPVADQPPYADHHAFADTAFKVKVKNIKRNEIEIKLPWTFGDWLFQGMMKNDDAFKTENFLKTFPGLSVTAGTGSDCVYGFNLTDTTCMLRLYYHITATYRERKTMTFNANAYNSFYNLSSDKENLPFYNTKSTPMPSSQTGNKGIVMSGMPMYTRLEFPHLNELLWLGQIVKIQKATLYIRPIHHSFDTVPLPPKLNIYYFDPTSNTPLSDAIQPPSMGLSQNTGTQLGNLPENYQNIQRPDFPQYSFDVTDFIASQLGKAGYDKWALCLLIPTDTRETTLQRLVFGDQNYLYKTESLSRENRIKLEVIYVVYNDY